ncbi:MAG: MSCRAMM family protein, partial [Planctomycetota bacterium]
MSSRNTILLLLFLLLLCCGAAYLLLGGGGDRDAGPAAPDGDSAAARPGDLPPGTGPGDASGEPGDTPSEDGAGEAGKSEEDEEFSFEKETPWSVAVRVLDREGKPLESKVEILDPRVEWSFGELPRKGQGAFAGFLPEPGTYAAEAAREGTRLRVGFEITEAEPAADVEIRYAGTGVVSGALFSTLGSLEDGVKGKYKVLGQEDLTVDLVAEGSGAEARLSCRVLASGEYRIDSVPAGDYLLRVKNKFYAARLHVAENEHVVHDILLGAGRIAGRVTDRETGEPLQTVQVVIQLSVPQSGKADLLRKAGFLSVSDRLVPDENGHYAFTNLPIGEYRLFSNGKDHAPLRKTATVSEDVPDVKLDFPLERGSSVDIAVLDLEGNPIENPLWITQGIRCGFVGHVTGLRVGKHDFITFAPGHEIQ